MKYWRRKRSPNYKSLRMKSSILKNQKKRWIKISKKKIIILLIKSSVTNVEFFQLLESGINVRVVKIMIYVNLVKPAKSTLMVTP